MTTECPPATPFVPSENGEENVVAFPLCSHETLSHKSANLRRCTTRNATGKSGLNNGLSNASSRIQSTDDGVVSCNDANFYLAMKKDKFSAYVLSLAKTTVAKRFKSEFEAWRALKKRCQRDRRHLHDDFQVFRTFLADIGPRPSASHSIDRFDNLDQEYAPGKVRWADPKTQANNRSTNIPPLTIADGRTHTVAEWAKITGQKAGTLRARWQRGGWSADEIVFGRRSHRPVEATSPSAPVPVCRSANFGWPSAFTPSRWEGPFGGWSAIRAKRHPSLGRLGATKPVFAAWIIGNNASAFAAVLNARHGIHLNYRMHGPHVFNQSLCEAVANDPDYVQLAEYVRAFDEARSMMTETAEMELCDHLLTKHRSVMSPKDAASPKLDFSLAPPRQIARPLPTPPKSDG